MFTPVLAGFVLAGYAIYRFLNLPPVVMASAPTAVDSSDKWRRIMSRSPIATHSETIQMLAMEPPPAIQAITPGTNENGLPRWQVLINGRVFFLEGEAATDLIRRADTNSHEPRLD